MLKKATSIIRGDSGKRFMFGMTALMLCVNAVFGADYIGTGNWDEDAKWTGGIEPTIADLARMNADDHVTVTLTNEVCDRFIIGQSGGITQPLGSVTILSGSLTTASTTDHRCGQTSPGMIDISGGSLNVPNGNITSDWGGIFNISGGTVAIKGYSMGSVTSAYLNVTGTNASFNATGALTAGKDAELSFTFGQDGVTVLNFNGGLTVNTNATITVDVSNWSQKGTEGATHDLIAFGGALTGGPFIPSVVGMAATTLGEIDYDANSVFVRLVRNPSSATVIVVY